MNKFCMVLSGVLTVALLAGCTPMEEKRDAHLQNAKAEADKGDCDKARAEAQAALDLDPAATEGFFIIAQCDIKDEKYKEAAAGFAKVLAATPDSIEALKGAARAALVSNQTDDAARFADKAEAFGDATPELFVIQGGVAMKKKLYPIAISYLSRALAAKPDNEEALVGLASAYLNTNQKEKAEELLAKAEKELPASATVLSLQLNMALQRRDTDTAEKYIQRLLLIKPGEPDLILQSADLRFLTGKQEEGLEMLKGFLEAHPDADPIRVRLAGLDADKGDFAKALAMLDAAPAPSGVIILHKASILGREGKTDEAIGLLKALAMDPTQDKVADDARFGLVEIYTQKNMQDEALAELNAIIAKNPDNFDAYSLRGRVQFKRQNYPEAVNDLEKACKAQPENHYAALVLADAYNSGGDPAKAEEIISEIIRKEPRFSQAYRTLSNLYLMQDKPEAALMTLSIGKASAPQDPSIPFAEADILTVLGRFDQAVEALEPLTKNKELAETALMQIANVYGEAGNNAKAASSFERVLAENPASSAAAEGRVKALIAQNKIKVAFEFMEKRFKERPDDPSAAFLYGETALASRNADKAIVAFRRALELAPQWDQPLTYLAQIYNAQGKTDEALKLAQETAAKAPDAPGPSLVVGMLQEQKKELDTAEKTYRDLLAKHPDNALANNNLAFLLTRHNPDSTRLAEAEKLAQKASETNIPATFDTLGWVQHLLGKNDEAEKNIRKAMEQNADNPSYHMHLAAIIAAQTAGKTDGASMEKKDEAKAKLLAIVMNSSDLAQKKEARKILDDLNK